MWHKNEFSIFLDDICKRLYKWHLLYSAVWSLEFRASLYQSLHPCLSGRTIVQVTLAWTWKILSGNSNPLNEFVILLRISVVHYCYLIIPKLSFLGMVTFRYGGFVHWAFWSWECLRHVGPLCCLPLSRAQLLLMPTLPTTRWRGLHTSWALPLEHR